MRFVTFVAVLSTLSATFAFAAGPTPRSLDSNQQAAKVHGLERGGKLTPKDRAPAIALDREGRAAAPPSRAAAVAAICSTSEFESLSGSALVSKIKTCDVASLNNLYNLTGTSAYYVFQESKMASVAYGLRDVASSYPGNNSTQALQLVTFLRAGYYVQYYNSASVGQYGATLQTAITAALDAFFANPNSLAVSDANGEVLGEAIILVDSATQNARYLSRMTDVLNRFDSSWLASWYMRGATNNVYTVTFRGHQNADFKTLIQSDQRIIDALYNFHNRWTSLLGTDNSYLTSNAAREMARFLQHTGAVQTKVRPLARDLLSRSSLTGPTAPVYVGVAEMVEYYDKANCSYYGTCNFRQQLEATVLPVSYSCSATLRIRAQEMTSAQLANTCATQAAEENRFHTMLETGRVPVSGDLNDDLEMVVFDSSTDYQSYAGVLFGIDTNNGGMYLEGNPTDANNQARFIAYEAEWLRPAFQIWNLEHEYIHYLDGRFDMAGDFNAYLTASTVWYIEGLAEYVAYVDSNQTAVDVVKTAAHVPLSTIFRNTYSSGTDRVYRWGYFAVRFMFERHRGEVRNILNYFRTGNYAAYNTYLLNTIGSLYDSEFQSWLAGVLNGGTNQPPTALQNGVAKTGLSAATGQSLTFTLDVPAGATNLNFAMSGGSGDADMFVKFGSAPTSTTYDCRPYVSGNNESCAINPAQAGRYYVLLSAYSAFAGVSLTGSFSAGSGNTPPVANFSFTVSGLSVTFTDSSTDANGTVASRSWAFGDGTVSSAVNPTKTYAAAGTYTVTLTVTDNQGATHSVAKSVTVGGGTSLPECTGSDTRQLGKNCSRSNRSQTAGNYDYLYLSVPAGVTQLKITVSGGTGNANLYVSSSGWATMNNYQYSSLNAGNNETLTIPSPSSGYLYISLHAASAFNAVKVSTEY